MEYYFFKLTEDDWNWEIVVSSGLFPPWECDRSHSLICCIAFSRGHRETAENLCRYSRPFNSLYPVYQSLKNDLPLSVSMCRPRTGGHPSKYWPSEKLLDLSDRIIPKKKNSVIRTFFLNSDQIFYKKNTKMLTRSVPKCSELCCIFNVIIFLKDVDESPR